MTLTHPQRAIDQLRARLSGEIITPDDANYDAARPAWNLTVDQRPALIVVPENGNDVAERGPPRPGRGSRHRGPGHGPRGRASPPTAACWCSPTGSTRSWSTATPGPPGSAPASSGPRCSTERRSTAWRPLLGSSPEVGAVGYTLGGGMGWLARRFGLSADHVRHFEVVTADGELRKVSADENADLFWALRGGGGGSFGIVTGMAIDLVPVTTVYGGNLFYPASMAREVVARYREWLVSAPDELTSSFALMNLPVIDAVPEPLRGRSFVVVRGCYCGPVAGGEDLLRFWREWRTPEIDLFGPMSFGEVAGISMDPVDPVPALSTSEWLSAVDDDLADVLARHLFERSEESGPSAVLFAEVRHAGGAVSAVDPTTAAYGNRDAQHVLQIVGIAPLPQIMAAYRDQVAAIKDELDGHTTGGVYINFLELDEKRERTRQAFSAESWRRLQAIKAEVDPENLFRHGFAIAPQGR